MTAGPAQAGWLRRPGNLPRLARWALVLGFLWLAGRYWHPYYGFTKFIQFDGADAATLLPEVREGPVYLYHDAHGYDGMAYAQLAAHPAARDPALKVAIDNVPYRARRILLSWVAAVLGGGDPLRAMQAYAWLNVVLWLGLAAVLARIFPPDGWRNLVAWTGLMFSAGVLHSVRFALTDLAALALLAAAVAQAERGRGRGAAGLFAAAGLVRETALLGLVALRPEDWRKDFLPTVARCLVAVLPLGLWLIYLRLEPSGDPVAGQGNFAWPLASWAGKLATVVADLRHPALPALAWTTALAFAGLTLQLLYLLLHPQPRDRWWLVGAAYGALMLVLGSGVWEGHPGAATRVLLPLGLAFNVLAVRGRAGAGWLVGGNLTVASGLLIFWLVPQGVHEFAAGRTATGSYVVHGDEQWYPAEHGGDKTWAWCGRAGGLEVECWPRTDGPVAVSVAVRGITAREFEIRQAGRTLWRGEIGERLQWIRLPALPLVRGRAPLELLSPTAPRAAAAGDARELGFAVYGVRVE